MLLCELKWIVLTEAKNMQNELCILYFLFQNVVVTFQNVSIFSFRMTIVMVEQSFEES